jgi:large repetitive protein
MRRLAIGLGITTALFAATAAPAAAVTFTNPAAITILDNSNAAPYPSAIAVAGMPADEVVTDVNVTLNGFSHAQAQDVGVVLAGPGGQSLLVMDGAGVGMDATTNANLTFDDAAGPRIPNFGALVTGTYRPGSYITGDSFPAPGPGTSYAHPGPVGGGTATLASVFNGTAANGAWNLFVRDFAMVDTGQIAAGWTLEVTTGTAPPPPPPPPPPPSGGTSTPAATGTPAPAPSKPKKKKKKKKRKKK